MAQFQPFGYKGEPGTCLWCGRTLRFERIMASDVDRDNPTYRLEGAQFATVLAAKPGRYWDGMFDTMDCGFQFGQRMAELGHRLTARNEEDRR